MPPPNGKLAHGAPAGESRAKHGDKLPDMEHGQLISLARWPSVRRPKVTRSATHAHTHTSQPPGIADLPDDAAANSLHLRSSGPWRLDLESLASPGRPRAP